MLQNRYSETQIMESSPVLSLSPSFSSYSSTRLAEIASRVVEEFRTDSTVLEDGGGCCDQSLNENRNNFRCELSNDGNKGDDDEKEDEEFEFVTVRGDFISSPAPADEIFYDGQIRPCFPLFNQDLLLEAEEFEKHDLKLNNRKSSEGVPPPPPRLSLRKLFIEDREPSSSCSSSEADELDGVEPGSYCVWNPKTAAMAEEARCKKSNSTGSSKRWRLRDLINRSHSDGKGNFVFLTHPSHDVKNAKKSEGKVKRIEKSSAVAPEVPKAAGKIAATVAPYGKDEGERHRMSFLPYRRDLVGLFPNVNGLGKNLHPF